jgi:thiamine biosynthesis lipoprotein
MRHKISILALTVVAVLSLSCARRSGYVRIEGYAQGGTYSVIFDTERVDKSPVEIPDAVESILRKIDFTLSGYNKNSVLSRFNAGETIMVDEMFAEIYSMGRDVWEETGGAVDVSFSPLYDLWGFGFKNGNLPTAQQVDSVRSFCGMGFCRESIEDMIGVEMASASLYLESHGSASPQLNYNAIAQGYSCDLVARYLYSIGVKDMMVNIGEIFCDGKNPSGVAWTIGIDRPEDGNNELGAQLQGVFSVPEGPHGVVTSGNYRKFYVKDGKKYAHTIDPRTGYPVTHNLLSATIVAADAMIADAYATYCMVIGFDEAKAFIESREDLEGCLVYDDGGEFVTWCSAGLETRKAM